MYMLHCVSRPTLLVKIWCDLTLQALFSCNEDWMKSGMQQSVQVIVEQ
jgi:hypothetical protein